MRVYGLYTLYSMSRAVLCARKGLRSVIDLKRGKPSTPAGLAPAILYGNYNIQHGKKVFSYYVPGI